MKLNVKDVEKFMEVVRSCEGPVWLTDWRVDESGDYNFYLNLKSEISLYLGVAKLLGTQGSWFELHAQKREDEARLIEFMKTQE